MKRTEVLFWNKWMRNGRLPARPPYRFTECKKLELKDRVTTSSKHAAELACNTQMMDMMACLKENDFSQAKCAKQINAFKNCYAFHLEQTAAAKKANTKDQPKPGENRMSMKQVNVLLKRHPQPR